MWTIAPEIKYYYLVPFISYFTIAFGKHWPIFWIISVTLAFLNQCYFNVFNVQASDGTLEMSFKLATWLPMFLSGSFMTIIYYKLEKSEFMKIIKINHVQNGISVLSFAMFLYGYRLFAAHWNDQLPEVVQRNKNVVSGFYWSIFLFLMLIGSPNFLTNIFSSSKVLKSFGKYSFGIYLLHPMYIRLVHIYYLPDTDLERILVIIASSYVSGLIFFHIIEDNLTNIANRICKFIDQKYSERKLFI